MRKSESLVQVISGRAGSLVVQVRQAARASEVVAGPGGRQIPLVDPAGNLMELFEPAT